MQNSDLWTRIKSLYGYQTAPVILCMQNSVISTRITSLYVSKPSSVVFTCKTATSEPEKFKTGWLAPEILVSICPRPHLWFWAHITVCLAQEYQDYMGSNPHLWLCACKTATLGPELQVSVGPNSHLWFFHAKQPLFPRITSLYGSQVWPVVLCI